MKHVIVAQDLSCFGKCSLTIALPVLSTAQIATSVFPSALLSSHTGGLGKVHIKDLHEGFVGEYGPEDVTDWLIYTPGGRISPDDVYRLSI